MGSRSLAICSRQPPASGTATVLRFAIASRLAVLSACLLSDALLPDHSPDESVLRPPPDLPRWLHAFARWDAARFLGIAERGYDSEESYAFFPLLPILMSVSALGLPLVTGLALAGLVITNACFVLSAWLLYRLGREVLHDDALALRAAQLFCLTPANVFMSSLYTESPFAACALGGLLLLRLNRANSAAAVFALGTGLRANGLLNCGFLAHHALLESLQAWQSWRRGQQDLNLGGLLFRSLAWALRCSLVVAPYLALQAYAAWRECRGEAVPTWCQQHLPNIYAHVQSTYWQVGPFRYWTLRQLPNFLLAGPALGLTFAAALQQLRHFSVEFRRALREPGVSSSLLSGAPQALQVALSSCPLLPHALHCGALAAFLLLCANVQVATRVLATASPLCHWFLASLLPVSDGPRHSEGHPAGVISTGPVRRLLWTYLVSWNVIGIVMHPNFLPWT
ncbi:unnamed protein product [Polarella glacialis]|uniref:GPI mannosyltransferase 2 n=1 Tax=Polarella glacialis TaxID=89957 RepID=A0A813H3N5_POLGL|nr:unnamed protein product [Polarella glacialis]